MSEGKGATQYERIRDAILMSLFLDHEERPFSKEAFLKAMEKVGYVDARTVRKYWNTFVTMGYIRQLNGKTALLSNDVIANGGRIRPLDPASQEVEVETEELMVR